VIKLAKAIILPQTKEISLHFRCLSDELTAEDTLLLDTVGQAIVGMKDWKIVIVEGDGKDPELFVSFPAMLDVEMEIVEIIGADKE